MGYCCPQHCMSIGGGPHGCCGAQLSSGGGGGIGPGPLASENGTPFPSIGPGPFPSIGPCPFPSTGIGAPPLASVGGTEISRGFRYQIKVTHAFLATIGAGSLYSAIAAAAHQSERSSSLCKPIRF